MQSFSDLFQVNEAANVVFMLLHGCFTSAIVLSLFLVSKIATNRLHVYTSLTTCVVIWVRKKGFGQLSKMLNDKFSLVRKHRSSDHKPRMMIFHSGKCHRSR